jgi:hypothetical protein
MDLIDERSPSLYLLGLSSRPTPLGKAPQSRLRTSYIQCQPALLLMPSDQQQSTHGALQAPPRVIILMDVPLSMAAQPCTLARQSQVLRLKADDPHPPLFLVSSPLVSFPTRRSSDFNICDSPAWTRRHPPSQWQQDGHRHPSSPTIGHPQRFTIRHLSQATLSW